MLPDGFAKKTQPWNLAETFIPQPGTTSSIEIAGDETFAAAAAATAHAADAAAQTEADSRRYHYDLDFAPDVKPVLSETAGQLRI